MNDKLKERLISLAKDEAKKSDNEDFNVYDWSGGNVDDAFEMGLDEGYTLLAREILDELNISY